MRRDIETIGRALSKVGAGGQINKHNRFAAPLDDEQAASTILHPSLCDPPQEHARVEPRNHEPIAKEKP